MVLVIINLMLHLITMNNSTTLHQFITNITMRSTVLLNTCHSNRHQTSLVEGQKIPRYPSWNL
jgi:hypothetical protein